MGDQGRDRLLVNWFNQLRVPLRKFLIGKGLVRSYEVDDVAQEVFLRLMRYNRTELIENPHAYLYKMASNVASEWAIRMRNTRPHDSKWLEGLAVDDQSFDQVDLQAELERALVTLTPRQRKVLKLQFFEGLSRTQIAERLGVTERVIKRILIKSYEKLRENLNVELL